MTEKIKKLILLFNNSSKELRKVIQNKYTLNHKEEQLWKALNFIKNNIVEIKQNSLCKVLLKEMYEYNVLLNEYNKVTKNKVKTFGDYFRDIGLKTEKSSVNTYFDY